MCDSAADVNFWISKRRIGADMNIRRSLRILAMTLTFAVLDGTAFAQPRTGLAVWDTGTSATETLVATTIVAKNGWKLIGSDETAHVFRGDIAIANGRVLAVARK